MKRKAPEAPVVAAVSGGPDSMFLLHRLVRSGKREIVVGHVNHRLRGRESEKDEAFVEEMANKLNLEIRILKEVPGKPRSGIEERARRVRREFLLRLAKERGGTVATAHTADDQVETILMRCFGGAGIAGLKGIPRTTADGFERPIIDIWKEDILKYLKKQNISWRIDRSNRDLRFERNWIRHVLVPLLEKRYGKTVKRRIFALGERLREIDDFLDSEAVKWARRRIVARGESKVFSREKYAALPTALRIRILQRLCHGSGGRSPNERLLKAMDQSICGGKPSNRVNVGGGRELVNRYSETRFRANGAMAGHPQDGILRLEDRTGMTEDRARRIAAGGNAEVFDAKRVRTPFAIRPLRKGDRILPFGHPGEKKIKEILIDRKVPREERWGRPVVCDSEGVILWVPGLIRSGHAPVTGTTRYVKILRYFVSTEGETTP